MTYHFTIMLMYRGCLLNEFLRTAASTPSESAPTQPVQRCVQAAIHTASFAAEIASDSSYNAVFWTKSYFTFCAISILVVYLTLYRSIENRRELEELLERAMQGHKRLDQSTELESQRLLEESQKLARTAGRPTNHDLSSAYTSTVLAVAAPIVANETGMLIAGDDVVQRHSAMPNHRLDSLCSTNDAFHDLVSRCNKGLWFCDKINVADMVLKLV
jgi:hypothetical protein